MSILHAAILGLIQGLTEFLPVSSSGHLVLFQRIFGIEQATQSFDIILHIATLIAVFICYWDDIWRLIKKPFQKTTYLLVAATIPTVIIALLFNDKLEAIFGNGNYIGFLFIFTAIVLFYADANDNGHKRIKNMSYVDALIIGTLQGVAICPAISRSGMTISGALGVGLKRNSAAKFSFLLSIPAILGAMVLTIKDIATGDVVISQAIGIAPMAVGFIVAAVTGFFAIKFMIAVVNKGKLKYFGIYVAALGVYLCLDQFLLHIIY
ncbi:MAG: undecaprenyl-diphosphate phosphatase [Clostridia bacterium]|jgi:undecaprenyl-diphosphatase|nr:undecaprenyl-diphosphate phosphatase [Clostridia bacterium]MCI2000318.1 undecaprenyl-diphosphate phosphatase [Clostridia bacterium]MCI2015498.1 undecaprenyl-diphosphate phosphatase [Clostridia bacterium]